MRILYAIQGTGNGHLSRARDIIPVLSKKGDLDILISGIQADVSIPYPIKYRLKGLSFIFGKQGGVDVWKTYKKSRSRRLYQEIKSIPIEDYDLVINDFEPVSAWAALLKKKPCIGLSHQCAILNKSTPKSKKSDPMGKMILKKYAPTSKKYGFHFQSYDDDIFTPVIRQQVREAKVSDNGYFTVYLPAYSDEKIIKVLSKIKKVRWEVFSKHNKKGKKIGNIFIRPINNDHFIKSLSGCTGILCGAGFETPSEALFLQKKLMVIPMKGQYEQQCNAAALAKMNVPVIKSLKIKHLEKIKDWITHWDAIKIDYPDQTEAVINHILKNHTEEHILPSYNFFGENLDLSIEKTQLLT